MAIKLPDPGNGIPEQKTGNDEWTNMKIVRDNFADNSNAASKIVGTEKGQVPLVEDVPVAFGKRKPIIFTNDLDDFTAGIYSIDSRSSETLPWAIGMPMLFT